MNKEHTCCICGKKFIGWGNNPAPLVDFNAPYANLDEEPRCCDECNENHVIPARLALWVSREEVRA